MAAKGLRAESSWILFGLTAAFLLAVWVDATPLLRGPAPFPPEWRWPLNEQRPLALDGLTLLSALVLIGLLLATGRAWKRPHVAARAVLILAAIGGLGLQLGLLSSTHANGALAAAIWRTDNPTFTGYFTVAASELAEDPIELLREYVPAIERARGSVAHVQTHPPGAVLFYRGVIAVCETLPPIARAAAARYELAQVDPSQQFGDRDEARRAAALLSPLLLMLAGAAACWPVASLAQRFGLAPLEAARAGALWTLVPAVTLMVPELDQLLTFLGACSVALYWTALATGRASWPRADLSALAAGFLAGVALFVSYGAAFYVPFGALALVACVASRDAWPAVLRATGVSAIGAVLAWLVPTALGYDPIASARSGLGTHVGSYVQQRSYALWLAFNVWDLAVFLSIPIAFLGLVRLREALRQALDRTMRPLHRAARWPLALATLLLVLDLTGLVKGETGRSWMPLMPFLLLGALIEPPREGVPGTGPGTTSAVELAILLFAVSWTLRVCWSVP